MAVSVANKKGIMVSIICPLFAEFSLLLFSVVWCPSPCNAQRTDISDTGSPPDSLGLGEKKEGAPNNTTGIRIRMMMMMPNRLWSQFFSDYVKCVGGIISIAKTISAKFY